MSAGPGTLQRKILDTLRKYNSFVAQRKILWEIAKETNKIEITGELSNGELRSGIPTGFITKPFSESFRRAVKSLCENGLIEIQKTKLTNLEEAFDYFPYHTSEVEIFYLRQKLLTTIIEYIKDEKPHRLGSSKIEEYQISEIKDTQKYEEAGWKWNPIQRGIISILHGGETDLFDQWVQCLVRGRYLFLDKQIAYSKSFMLIYNNLRKQENKTIAESNMLKSLKALISSTFDKTDWELGRLKSALYGVGQFQKYQKDTLNEEVKDSLLEKHAALITALPGQEEPEKIISEGRRINWAAWSQRKYSEYLDKLLTKQILKNHSFIKAN